MYLGGRGSFLRFGRHLHIENIFAFFILYGTAHFCPTSTLMKDFIEALEKRENSGGEVSDYRT